MLRSLEKTSLLHSILAGMLAIDSCCKAIEKEEERVLKNCMKGLTVFLGHYKRLEDELAGKIQGNELYLKLQDSLKYFSYQLYILPTVARLFPDDITKQK